MNYLIAIPEIFILSMACIILLADAFFGRGRSGMAYGLSLVTLLLTLGFIVFFSPMITETAFHGLFVSDRLSELLKLFIVGVSFMVLVYSREYLAERNLFKGEFYVLVLLAVLGMMIMASAPNFLSMYLGLELLSLSQYAMVAMRRDSGVSAEAAMKFFVLGAIASGMLLYGMSLIYGVTGSLDLSTIHDVVAYSQPDKVVLVFALVFIVAGIAFKLGAAPFHMWAPDVYEGAPTAMTLFIGTAPKIAGFALAFRLLIDGLEGLVASWQQMLIILAVFSIGLGNVVAIAQTNIKRMLAYSGIAHMGYMVLGLIAGTADGYAASLFYTLVYAIMAAGAFGFILLHSRQGFESDQLDDMKGLARLNPWFGLVMLVLMFSMAGVPPFIGFWSKWFVLKEIIAAGYVWLAAIAVFFAIVGAFVYLRIIRLIYFDRAEEEVTAEASGELKLVLSLNGLVVLLLGIMPSFLLGVCLAVFH